jgi:predicted alpha/beta superfamily hydrolase
MVAGGSSASVHASRKAMSSLSSNDHSPLADSEVHFLTSDHVGDEFKIFIGHCGESGAEPAAVLYLTDANGIFAGAVELVRFMQLSGHLPAMLVVGIGYRVGALHEAIALRTRDLTPSSDPSFAAIFPGLSAMGGAGNLLAFIRNELIPWVEARYPVGAARTAYFGHSLGGLFGTYVLLTEPTTFHGYGIGSPSLWWDYDAIFQREQRYAEAHSDLPARVFFSVGEYEDHDGRQREAERLPADERAKAGLRHIDMVAGTDLMVATLRGRNFPSLSIDSATFPGEFHVTVQHLNLSRSVRHLFDAPL